MHLGLVFHCEIAFVGLYDITEQNLINLAQFKVNLIEKGKDIQKQVDGLIITIFYVISAFQLKKSE